ncbi:MAG: ABC transporter ATP-binding protein [Acidobacteria bacterium]|nr:ABC transporter ATP-binding protein [Acidobacteriota bacterium]
MSERGPAIRTRGLTKRFGGTLAVDRLDLDVGWGEVFGFIGPNGAGKTTTIRMLTGLLQPTGGTAVVAGFDVAAQAIEVKRRVAYLADNPFLYPKLTGREFLGFVADLYAIPRADADESTGRLLALLDLDERVDDRTESYSRGMRQKLGLAAALLHEPQVLLLDEPLTALDPRSARVVKDLLAGLARRGRAVFLSTHVLEVAERLCARVAIIDRGRAVAVGTLDELRERSRAQGDSLEDIFLELTGGPEVEDLTAVLGD